MNKVLNGYVLRVAKSNDRCTKGKIYKVTDYCVVDDLGGKMEPTSQNNKYWIAVVDHETNKWQVYNHCDRHAFDDVAFETNSLPHQNVNDSDEYFRHAPSFVSCDPFKKVSQDFTQLEERVLQQQLKDGIMLNIKKVTLINSVDSDTYTVDGILTLIEIEEACITRLENVGTTSKAVAKLMAKHKANIKSLIVIMDKMV